VRIALDFDVIRSELVYAVGEGPNPDNDKHGGGDAGHEFRMHKDPPGGHRDPHDTPVEAVFDDCPRRSGLVFVVHMWNPNGPDPQTIADVMRRQKDVQYNSRAHSHIVRQQQIHRMRHIIAELVARLPESERQKPEVEEMAGYGCLTQIHVVRLLAPPLDNEDHFKDIDFSPAGIKARWKAGYENTRSAIVRAPWNDPVDPLEGFVLHEAGSSVWTEEPVI